jgi:phage regulator Rha-like protein
LKSQFVISSWGGSRANPYAFTEQGVAMLSSVLRTKRAVQFNIAIIRAFVKLREMLSTFLLKKRGMWHKRAVAGWTSPAG